jgi:hypothetical protein
MTVSKQVIVPRTDPASQSPPFGLVEITAINALILGKATDAQQLQFIEWFNKATGVDQNPYRPGGDDARRETDIALGRKLVGDWFYGVAKAKTPRETKQK